MQLPNTITGLGDWTFKACTKLQSITLPDSITYIGSAFYDCSSLSSVKLPESLTIIGTYAFIRCENLISIDIPPSVTEIRPYAFSGCKSLHTIKIPDSVTYIGDEAFSNCNSLTTAHIGSSVEHIGVSAFGNCQNLTSLTMGNSIISISSGAFGGCQKLTSIVIPASLYILGGGAWYDCPTIEKVEYMTEKPCESTAESFLSEVYQTATLYIPTGTKETFLATEPWKYFKNIQEKDNSAIDTISVNEMDDDIDFALPYSVYSLNGICMGNDITTLTNGIYIIRQGTNVKKYVRNTY